MRGAVEIDPTRAAIVRLGAEAAAELAAIPDTPELQAGDCVFVAEHPLAAYSVRRPMVRQMHRLVERYRVERGIDTAAIELTIAEAYARCFARLATEQAGDTARAAAGEP